MTVLLLHGGSVDDLLLDIVLPVVMFIGLYVWADRRSKREKAAKLAATKAVKPVRADESATPVNPVNPVNPIDPGPEPR